MALEYSHKAAVKEKRGVGPVTVLQAADLDSCSSLGEKVDKMCENRYDIFLHNVEYLRKKYKLSQAQLCSKKLCGRISTQQMATFKNPGKDIPLNAIIAVASAFDLTLEEMCGQLLDKKPQLSEGPAFVLNRPIEEYEKYTGLYDLVYFDPSKPLGKNPNPAADALCGGVLTIYAVYSAAGAVEFCVAALLGCTAEERKKVAGMLEGMDLKRDGAQVYTHYESAARSSGFSGDDGSRMKCLYSGKLSLSQEMVDITLQQVTNSDFAAFGSSGAGKSTMLQCIAKRLRKQGRKIVCIVPEKGHEYRPLCEAVGGQFIKLGTSSPDCIGLMEIRRFRMDAYGAPGEVRRESLLAEKVSWLSVWYSLQKRGLTEEDKSYIDASLIECYRRRGIDFDNASLFREDGVTLKEMPVIKEWYDVLMESPETRHLAVVLTRYVTGSAASMGGRTNVDTNNSYTVIDLTGLSDDLQLAAVYAATGFATDIIVQNTWAPPCCPTSCGSCWGPTPTHWRQTTPCRW